MSKPFKMKAAGHNNSPMQKNFPKDIGAKPGETPNKNILGGAAAGAKMGSAFGPWGTAIGAVAGGVFGGIKANKARKEEEALAEVQKLDQQEKDKILAEVALKEKRLASGSDENLGESKIDMMLEEKGRL